MARWIREHRIVAALVVVVGLGLAGVAAFGVAGGLDETTTVRVAGDGAQVVRVALVDRSVGFDVAPDVVEVEAGTHVVLEVVNEADDHHDLALDGGPRTDLLAPGESQRVDLGPVTGDVPGRCTVGDHDVAGMTFGVRLAG